MFVGVDDINPDTSLDTWGDTHIRPNSQMSREVSIAESQGTNQMRKEKVINMTRREAMWS